MNKEKLEKIKEIEEKIKKCKKCPLHISRTNPVPGEGPIDAEVMLIGEAPGKNEDLQGRPFVGRAGELLNELLQKAGLRREEVFITNVVKCRPPRNRDPKPEEIDACLPYLISQLRIIKPKIIICLGRFAGATIFKLAKIRWEGMYRTHGKVFNTNIEGIPLRIVATFHPASAFYRQEVRDLLEKDFERIIAKLVKDLRDENNSRKPRNLFDFM